MKKIRGNESIGAIIHIYIEISQGNSLYSYLYFKQAKCQFFLFFFLQNWRPGRKNRSCSGGGDGTCGRGRESRKRVKEGEYGAKNVYTCM
jgi:hypothetical protein